ncbi:hypothetical protein EV1_002532 [Malus domestica]
MGRDPYATHCSKYPLPCFHWNLQPIFPRSSISYLRRYVSSLAPSKFRQWLPESSSIVSIVNLKDHRMELALSILFLSQLLLLSSSCHC